MVQQESIPWQSFVFDAAWSSRFETPRSAPVPQAFLPVFRRGWAMAIFILTTRTAEVCPTVVYWLHGRTDTEASDGYPIQYLAGGSPTRPCRR